MPLPGGIWIEGERHREFRFGPVDGELELLLGESLGTASSHPARVTQVLCQALESLGGMPADPQRVRRLCVGDRQYLMRQLAALLEPGPQWLTTRCRACGELFEISFTHAELPIKPSGEGFPRTRVPTAQGEVWVRCPTGEDQEALAAIPDDGPALEHLLSRLVTAVQDGREIRPRELSAADRRAIEVAVEAISPEVATQSQSHCPHCGSSNLVDIGPYACLERTPGSLFEELHTLAMHYHWSEEAILKLPRSRRRTYLGLIDRSRNMHGAEAFITHPG
jgi:hypothetical protein